MRVAIRRDSEGHTLCHRCAVTTSSQDSALAIGNTGEQKQAPPMPAFLVAAWASHACRLADRHLSLRLARVPERRSGASPGRGREASPIEAQRP